MKNGKWTWILLAVLLLCLPAAVCAEETVTLTLEKTEILVGETIRATIDLGEEGADFVTLMAKDAYEWETELGYFSAEEGKKLNQAIYDGTVGGYDEETWRLYAIANYDGVEVKSNEAEVVKTSKDYIRNVASITITAPGEVKKGEDLTFSVEGSELLTQYAITVHGDNGEEICDFDRAGEFTIPAASLVRGKCWIKVNAWAVGYSGNVFEEVCFYYDIDKTVHFSIDKTEVLTLENFTILASCPDADFIRIYRLDEDTTDARYEFGIYDKEKETVSCYYTDPFKAQYYAAAVFGDEEVLSEKILVTVSAPNGKLGEIGINAESMRLGDGDMAFTVDFPKEATVLALWYSSDDGDLFEYSEEGSGTYTIPAAVLRPGSYYIRAEAQAEGWESTEAHATFYVYGNTPEDGHKHVAYCHEPKVCRLCGAPADTVELTLEHDWDSNFQYNARYHWTTCVYGDEKLTAEHEFGEDGYCIYCGMEKAQGIRIEESTFPDAEFRKWVAENADRDGDGILSEAECSDVTGIDVSNRGITSLKGIEFFPELGTLNCADNSLTGLDLSGNRKLAALNCENNQIRALYLKDFLKLTLSYRGNTGIQVETAHGIITWIPGDADGNGKTDAQDVLEVLRYLNGQNASLHGINGDVNADGKTDLEDAMLILQYACGWDVTLK